jgi:hypothetical protein
MTETNAPYNVEPPAGSQDPKAGRELYRQEGDTPRTIRVSIDHHGDLEVGSHDFPGPLARPFAAGGASEYEYFATVPAAEKDSLLLALVLERYKGNPDAVEDFRRWCESNGVPCRFSTWGHDYC